MGWFTNLFGGGGSDPVQLKLDAGGGNRFGSALTPMPKAPTLDTTLDNLLRYAKRSELVWACIEKKAQAACDPELVVERRTADGEWEAVKGHKLVNLMQKPNPWDDGESFRRAWVASENFADVFYAEIVRSGAGVPVGLYPLHPGCIFPQYRATASGDVLDHYVYRINGYEVRYQPEELLIRRRHGLGSVFAGISAVQVALGTIDADTAMTEYVRAFFNNGGIPSGVITVQGRLMDEAQLAAFQQKWITRYGRGGRMQGGPAVLQDGATYEPIGAGLDNLASDILTEIAETRICMAFGVPPVLIGSYVGLKNVNQKASFMGAMTEFWMNTMSPELKSIRNFLTWNLLPEFEPLEQIIAGNIRVNWDLDQVDALQEDVDAIHKRARENYQAGLLTLNEARADIAMPEVDGETGDAFFKEPGAGDPFADPNAGQGIGAMEPKKTPQVTVHIKDDSNRLGRMLDFDVEKNGNGSKKNFDFEGMTLGREPTPLERSIDLKAISDSFDRGKESLARVIQTMRGDLIGQAQKAVRGHDAADIHTLNLTPPAFADKSVTREIRKAFDEGRRQVAAEAPQKSFAQPVEKKGIVDDLLRELVDLTISRVIGEVASAAVNIFTRLGVLGYSSDEIEQEIKAELEDRSDKPFEGIARQAVNKAVNEGRAAEMRERSDDIRLYEYSAILDANTCTPCADWDTAQADDPAQLPDTPNPECEGGANCRCFIIAIYEGEAT